MWLHLTRSYWQTKNLLFIFLFSLLFLVEVKLHSRHISTYSYTLFMIVSALFFYSFTDRKLNKKQTYFVLAFFLLSVSYLIANPIYKDYLKYIIYLSPTIFICNLMPLDTFVQSIIRSVFIVVPLFFITYFLGLGIDSSYGSPRLQGFLTEPSAMALPLSIYFYISLLQKKSIVHVLFALLMVYLAASPSVVIIIFLSAVIYLVSFIGWKYRIIIFLLFTSLITNLVAILESINVYVPSKSIDRLIMGVKFAENAGAVGHNPRFHGVMELMKDVSETPFILYFGRGLNSATFFYKSKGELRFAYNIQTEVLFSFGLVGLFFLMIGLIYLVLKIKDLRLETGIFIATIIAYTSLNSAQGIGFQILLWISLSYIFFFKNNTSDHFHHHPRL